MSGPMGIDALPTSADIFPMSADIRQMQGMRTYKLWSAPLAQRPQLSLSKGDIALMLDRAYDLQTISPAAAVALMDFVCQHNSDHRGSARARLTALLQQVYPQRSAITSAEIGREEAVQAGDDQLTAHLSQIEIDFLSFMHGLRSRRSTLPQLAERLTKLADALDSRDSLRRQASARIILADIMLRQGDFEAANSGMGRGLSLLGRVVNDTHLRDLASDFGETAAADRPLTPSGTEAPHRGF